MKETTPVKIEIPKGYEIDKINPLSGEVSFKPLPKDVMGTIRTVSDILSDNGLTQEQFDEQCKGLEEDEVAYRILKLLAKSLNEGWTPDWNSDDQYKYFAWFYMGGSSGFRYDGCDGWISGSNVGSRLCFKSSELAEYAGKQFTQVFKQFMIRLLMS